MKKLLFALIVLVAGHAWAVTNVASVATMGVWPTPYAGQEFFILTPVANVSQRWIFNKPGSFIPYQFNSGTVTATPTITQTPTNTPTQVNVGNQGFAYSGGAVFPSPTWTPIPGTVLVAPQITVLAAHGAATITVPIGALYGHFVMIGAGAGGQPGGSAQATPPTNGTNSVIALATPITANGGVTGIFNGQSGGVGGSFSIFGNVSGGGVTGGGGNAGVYGGGGTNLNVQYAGGNGGSGIFGGAGGGGGNSAAGQNGTAGGGGAGGVLAGTAGGFSGDGGGSGGGVDVWLMNPTPSANYPVTIGTGGVGGGAGGGVVAGQPGGAGGDGRIVIMWGFQ